MTPGKKDAVYYSCHKNKHILEMCFVMSKRLKQLVIGYNPVNPRICCIRIKGKFFNYSIKNGHAPTEEKPDNEKEDYYEELKKALMP